MAHQNDEENRMVLYMRIYDFSKHLTRQNIHQVGTEKSYIGYMNIALEDLINVIKLRTQYSHKHKLHYLSLCTYFQ
jgi:hypothetical protein